MGRMNHDTVDAAEVAALTELRLHWGATCEIGFAAGQWGAARRDGTGQVLSRASAAGLAMALQVSYGRPR